MVMATKISIVLPVRDGQDRIAAEVRRVIQAIEASGETALEVIVVDDGSQDRTREALESLRREEPRLRIARHVRPRGLEAAGQTGLERAIGELVLIQEDDLAMRLEDLRQLLKLAADPSIVAARAQSTPRPIRGPLMRRFRAWGAQHDAEPTEADGTVVSAGIQLIRRPHLQRLATPQGRQLKLQSNRIVSTAQLAPASHQTMAAMPTPSP